MAPSGGDSVSESHCSDGPCAHLPQPFVWWANLGTTEFRTILPVVLSYSLFVLTGEHDPRTPPEVDRTGGKGELRPHAQTTPPVPGDRLLTVRKVMSVGLGVPKRGTCSA